MKESKQKPAKLVKTLKTAVLAVLLMAGISALGGLSCAPSRPARQSITYAMPITLTAVIPYVASEKGFWKEEGLDVKVQMFSAGRLALDALLSKNAEVMSVSETPLVHAIVQGNKIFLVSTVASHHEVKFLGRRDKHIARPEDLRGKAIATLPGTNSDYFMYEFLKKHGIPVNAVKITNMSPPEMVTAFANGAIDGYFAWEPHIYYGEQQLPGKTIVFGPGDLYRGWHSVAMNQDFVKAHPEVVQKLIRGFIKAEEYIHQNPEEAMTIVAKVTGVDKEAIRKLWPEMKPVLRLDKDLIDVMNQEGQWSLSLNPSATTAPKWRDFIYSDALDAVRPSSVNLN